MWFHGWLPVLAGTAAGLAAAAALMLAQSSTYRADASIALVWQGQPPGDDPALAQAAADLFHSRAVAEPAVANLRLDESPDELLERVSIDTEAASSLVRISVEAPSPDEARRTAQELTELATVRFNDRFGPGTVASIWEASRAKDDRVPPRPARNLALGGLAGALLGLLLRPVLGRRPRPRPVLSARPTPMTVPRPAPRPERQAEPALEPEAEPEPLPEPDPEPEPVSTGPFARPRLGEWTIADVERLLAQEGSHYPDRLAELAFYVDTLRDVAEGDGRLPGGVDVIVEDVFGDLIGSAEHAERTSGDA